MGFQVSPGVQVKEIDLTNIVPAVATTIGAVAGAFQKGPVGEVTQISSEQDLVRIFGLPQDSNNQYEDYFTAANFLQYTNTLKVVRAESAILNADSDGTGILIKSTTDYQESYRPNLTLGAANSSVGAFAGRTAGVHANGIKVDICTKNTFTQNTSKQINSSSLAAGDTVITLDAFDAADFAVGQILEFYSDSGRTTFATGHEGIRYEIVTVTEGSETLTIRQLDDPAGKGLVAALANDSFVTKYWKFFDLFDGEPGTSEHAAARGISDDELHIVVYDSTGAQTGFDTDTAGNRTNSVIETYAFLSKNPEATDASGNSLFYPDRIYAESQFVYVTNHLSAMVDGSGDWGIVLKSDSSIQSVTAYNLLDTGPNVNSISTSTLTGGTDDYAVTDGEKLEAYNRFKDAESEDVNLIMAGKASATLANNLITISENRKDCMTFVSPERSDVVGVPNSETITLNVKGFFDALPSSSYVVFDSGYKYMYDRFNDVYRYVPLNGDVAGLVAQTEQVAEAFFSPGGFNRGQIRGAVSLPFVPTQSQRDTLYKARINPVVSFPGQGTILFGDKTGLAKPSAFDRINVRRLFIILEKAIATAAKFQLFEFNDEFTRAQFKNLVEPFLREIQGKRGITDFSVISDETNNTGEVIDRNEFVADIFVKPARAINFITLNFIAVRTGVAFSEVGG